MNATPYESNVKDKLDVLDWRRLPAGECDLNFRKPSCHQPHDLRRALSAMLKIAMVTVLVGIVLRTNVTDVLFTPDTARTVVMVAVAMFLVIYLGLFRVLPVSLPPREVVLTALLAVAGILALWFFAGMLGASPAAGLLLLLSAALPVIACAADSLATHWWYWCTANPAIDRVTMTGWREDWGRRFGRLADRPLRKVLAHDPNARQAHQRAMSLRRSYPWGFVWLAIAYFGVPAIIVALAVLEIVERIAFWMVVEVTLVLLWLAVMRGLQVPGSWRVFLNALSSWANYGRNTADPPWVFQSPSGSQLRRAVYVFFAIVLLAISLFPMLQTAITPRIDAATMPPQIDRFSVVGLSLGLVAAVVLPAVWFVLSAYVVSAPALAAVHLACETETGFERHDGTELDGYFERLRNSRNPEERRHLMAGYNTTHEYPYLLDSDLLFEHCHMLGATGIGKTALGLSTYTIQLIRRGDGPVIIIDCKGDPAFFHTARIEAERAGRKFKWFTNKPYRSTYVFNPLNQPHLPGLSLPEMIGLVTQSLNLHHGDDYGRAWFSIGSRVLLKAGLLTATPAGSPWVRPSPRYTVGVRPPVQSFRDLEEALLAVADDEEEYKAGKHLLFLVESLADFEQLNLAPNHAPGHPALQHAICMPEVIERRQVVYFYLVGAMDIASVGELARMVLYSALSAAIAHRDRTGRRPRVYCVADEAQALAAKNLEMVLAQAREHGLACTLAHQAMSQLNPPGGVDLRELVMNCTAVKQYFSARDPVLQKYISQISGTVRYWDAAWNQVVPDILRGAIGRHHAAGEQGETSLINVQERLGFRLESEDLNDISRNLNESVFCVDRASGYSRYYGAFPMHSEFPVKKSDHDERRERLPWPDGDPETLTITGLWPAANGETITPKTHPGPGLPDPGPVVQETLQKIRDRLKEDA